MAGILAYVYSEQIDRVSSASGVLFSLSMASLQELKQSFKQTLTTKYSVDQSVTQAADLLHQNVSTWPGFVFLAVSQILAFLARVLRRFVVQ